MWRRSISIAFICVFIHNDDSGSSSFGLRLAAAQQNQWSNNYGGGANWNVADHQFYKALNVTPDATEKQIKSSYRKLALELHPDKFKPDPNSSDQINEMKRAEHEERFVEISAAYDVLGDEKKRKVYDQFGHQGLAMLARGQDPTAFGGGFGGFGGYGGMGGFPSFNQADAQKMFQDMFKGMPNMGGMGGFDKMFSGGMPNMGGFPNMGGYGGMGGSGMPDFDKMFQEEMAKMGNMGGMGGFPNMGGFNNMGGFPGGGGGRGAGGGGSRRQERPKPRKKRPENIPDVFTKGEESGIAPLSMDKFPDIHAKHGWLIYFYDKAQVAEDPTTEEYVSVIRQLSTALLKKAEGKKNGMLFKIGAIDCSGNTQRFCKHKLGGAELPTFATVFNGNVGVIPEDDYLKDGKQLYDATVDAISKIDGLVTDIESFEHVRTRLLGTSPRPGQKTVAVVLLNDKNDTPMVFKSLAYRHRMDGIVFGESRGSNTQVVGKGFGVKQFPNLLAIIGTSDSQKVEGFKGQHLNAESLSKWIDGLGKHTRSN